MSKPATLSGAGMNICVCVCTYRRHGLLQRLLTDLQKQATDGLFAYSVVVVDNDAVPSARPIVEEISEKASVNIGYFHEPRRNISHARNLAVEKAVSDFVAFIDDDEFPADRWLVNLYQAQRRFKADGVLGPVIPHFAVEPPGWLVRSKLCERPRLSTGSVVTNDRDTRTGNVLLAKDVLRREDGPFHPRFGTSGGGDKDYFMRMVGMRKKFVWCDEACVYETVTLDRYARAYYIRRALVRGSVTARMEPLFGIGTAKSLLAVPLYAVALPFLQLIGHHFFMRYLIKECDHVGKLAARLGINIVKDRPY